LSPIFSTRTSYLYKVQKMAKHKLNIEYIILWRNINGIASEDEVVELQKWLADDEKHRLLYKHLKVNSDKDIIVSEELITKQWTRLQMRIERKTLPQLKTWISYAASVAAVIMIAFLVYLFSTTEPKITTTFADNIQPGQSKATLFLANGDKVELNNNKGKQVIRNKQGQILASDSLNTLNYQQTLTTEKIEYNTMFVERGGVYELVLSDGTKVWLNSETKLRYPIAFIGDSREVYLDGEASFEVSKDKQKPFLVHSNLSTTKVYGTVFNVMSYASDKEEQTTLVEGSIAVLHNGKEVMVQPGQQARINKSGKELTLEEVDTDLYTDWKNGIFRFEDMPLGEVALKLSRWYDVQFYFANEEVNSRRITGAMKRTTDFTFFMELIEKSAETEITINDKAVFIKAKH